MTGAITVAVEGPGAVVTGVRGVGVEGTGVKRPGVGVAGARSAEGTGDMGIVCNINNQSKVI